MLSKEELRKLFGKEEYENEFFKEKGFIRKKGKVCGKYFWTLDPERETCGDVECEGEYRFIEGRRWQPEWDIHNTIRKWLKFFEERGHAVLEPYPVVARWRDDLEFTIASIVDFQPWVTEGIVDPPANPLVIPQPCLRFGGDFNDLDNIGKTGRHLTSFFMGGQHAFNSEKFWAYWKDGYVRLNFEFMTKVLNIPEKELTYIEDVWAGGGNFGPSLETFAYGLEIVNGVFMQYKFINGGYEPLKLKVLDVGWGLERISWFMQKTPTIYEATFGPVFEWLIKHVGLEYDLKLVVDYARLSGILDTSSPEKFKETRALIAKKLDLTLDELERRLGPLEAIYAILDHTRTLVIAIPDGALPANIGGAYNLRVILRRSLSLAEKYGFDIDWYELLDRQIDYISITLKKVLMARDIIKDVWRVESKRYKQTLEKGLSELLRILKKRKVKKVGYDILKELYINHGLPPSAIEKVAEKLNVEVEVPPNFFELVRKEKQAMSMREKVEEKKLEEIIEEEIGKEIEELPETRKLYYEDRYAKEADGTVIFKHGRYVVLDQTIFYPEGGGQAEDTGYFYVNGKEFRVVHTRKIRNVIVHVLERPTDEIRVGDKVHMKIDWDRRYALMKHHTATHIITGAAYRVLGPHVWQVGADKSPERARLDISHYKHLTEDQILKIEELANKVVMEMRPVKVEVLPRTEAEKKYGFRIYQGGAIPEKELRIVSVEGWDVEACGGTHLKNTGELGLIKIIGTKKIHDGVIRLIFVAGEKAHEYIRKEEKYLKEASSIVRVEPKDLPKTVKRFFDEWKAQQNVIKRLSKEFINYLDYITSSKEEEINGLKVSLFRLDIDHDLLIEALKRLNTLKKNALLASTFMGATRFIVSGDDRIAEAVKRVLEKSGGKIRKIKLGYIGETPMDATTFIQKVKNELKQK